MPLIQIKVFEDEVSPDQAQALVSGVTAVIGEVLSDKLCPYTWVVIEEVRSGHWGIGGNTLGLSDVKEIIAKG
jgi:4-oxalocrotonate tautomerase